MSRFLDKLRGLPSENKTKIAILGSVLITFIVLMFYIVYSNVSDKKENTLTKQPFFEGKQIQEIKNSFNNLFK